MPVPESTLAIAVDATPDPVVAGAVSAARNLGVAVELVGPRGARHATWLGEHVKGTSVEP